jgi:hypothetical protein
MIKFRGQLYEYPADASEEDIATALKSTLKNPWARVGMVAWIAFGIPLAVLALGATCGRSRGSPPPHALTNRRRLLCRLPENTFGAH